MAERRRPPLRWLRFAAEAGACWLLLRLFAALSRRRASAIGGAIAETIGPRLAVSDTARRNLRAALPEFDDSEIEATVRGVWDNLGRLGAELAHLRRLRIGEAGMANLDVEVIGADHARATQGGAAVFVAAHLGNWEVVPFVARAFGMDVAFVYREPNNPWVAGMLNRLRDLPPDRRIAKGPAGARQWLRILAQGGPVGLLNDQKMNDGIAVPFFGRPAMTAPAAAQSALRYRAPVVPVRCERLPDSRFRITIEPPLPASDARAANGAPEGDQQALLRAINARFEDWIRARPAEWLWLHRRWPD